MTRRRLTAIRLDKIAAVDKPCQHHATVAIVKRAPAGPADVFKQTFQQALGQSLLNDQVREAFYGAFDNMYEGKDAFRTALIDEFTAGGDGSVSSDAYKAWLTGLVDRAVTTVRAAGAANIAPETIAKAFTDEATEWLDSQQEQTTMNITTKAQLLAAVAKFDPAKDPAAHVTIIQKAATDLDAVDALPAEGILALPTATAPTEELAVLKRRLDVAEMPAPIRKHYEGLDEPGKTAFIAKSATERQAELDAIEKGDPIVFTTASGVEIRKSDGRAAEMLARENDKLSKKVSELSEGTATASIEKRAAAYPNVAKETAVSMLKSADQVGVDSPTGKDLLKSLAAMNTGTSGLFKRIGTEGGGDDSGSDISKARQTFDGKVEEIKKRDASTLADAMSKARVECPDLYAEAYPEPAAA